MPAVQPGSNTFRQTGIAHRASKDLVLATLHQHRFTAFSLLLCTVGTVLLICGYQCENPLGMDGTVLRSNVVDWNYLQI